MKNNKKLVVYFSYTNNTKFIAEIIKNKLNCDILEIKPKEKYSDNYDLVVKQEQNNSSNKTPEIENINIDLNDYDEIIIGTPVWWYTIAPVIRTFLTQNDLTGKKIVPFATNAGWLGHTFQEIKKICPNSNIENEMDIVFNGYYDKRKMMTSPDEVENWINNL